MGFNRDALRAKVYRAIMKAPDVVDIYRRVNDRLGEPEGDAFVARLTGQYYKARNSFRNSFVTTRLTDSGEVKSTQAERFITVVDDAGLSVREGDFFELNGVVYRIVDISSCQSVYIEFALERS